MFCNYDVCSYGTWRKGPGQSPCNVLSISDLELYIIEGITGVCDPITHCGSHALIMANSQYGAQLCIGYITGTVFLARNTGTGTMRKCPAQIVTVAANVGRELPLSRMAIDMANADYLVFFSLERPGAPLPTAGSGIPGISYAYQ